MIVIETVNGRPMPQEWMAIEADALVVVPARPIVGTVDFAYCGFENDYTELALADTTLDGLDNKFHNDTSSFMAKSEITGDTIEFFLIKEDGTAIPLIDSTYGTFTPIGGFPTQPLQSGFTVDWQKVKQVQGTGYYHIRVDQLLIGQNITSLSRRFWCANYSDKLADKTFRIETVQNGNIESSVLDYTGIEWPQSFRIYGKFGSKDPELIVDKYPDSERTQKQIQDEIRNLYTLATSKIPAEIGNALIYDNLLANSIFISDYNIWNYEVYRGVTLYPEEIVQTDYSSETRMAMFTITLSDKKQNILKRN